MDCQPVRLVSHSSIDFSALRHIHNLCG